MDKWTFAMKVVSLFVAVVLALAFTPTPIAQAQGDDPTDGWTKHNIDDDLDGASGVYVHDIDSDGNPDVVATAYFADDVVWYEAPDNPANPWTRHHIDSNLGCAYGIYVYDINADGNPDVVATGVFPDALVWYEAPADPADPAAAWTKHNIDSSLGGAHGVYVHDIDTDGDPDVVATGADADDVVWYEAPPDPTGLWTKHDIHVNLDGAHGVSVHDIDADGNPDVVATGYYYGDVAWYEAPDNPTNPWTEHNIDTGLDGAYRVCVHDIDADGDLDVVASGARADDVVWYEAPADPADPAAAWTKHNIDTDLDGALDVHVHDMDSDGNLDVVASGARADDVVWYEAPADPADPAAAWTKHNIDTDLDGAGEIHICDIDADGTPDVVTATEVVNDVVWYRMEWESYKTGYFPAGDVCNLFDDYNIENTVYMYGAAFKRPANPTGSWDALYEAHYIDTDLDGGRHVCVHDINADGNPDVVATAYYGPGVVWYEAPTGATDTWTKHIIDKSPSGAYGVAVHDIDGDGNPDVVAAGIDANAVVWYEAPDDPTTAWTKHNIDSSLGGAYGVAVHDIDGDYNRDVVAAGIDANAVVWYEATDDPTGTWTKHNIDSSLGGACSVYVYDIDYDGNHDVVASGANADAVVWYEAPDNPTGTWTKHNIDTDLDCAWVVYVHDMDADGDPDVVATGFDADDVVWYEAPADPADPAAAWTKHNIDSSLDGADGVYVSDIDADGDPDVVATGFDADDVVWYEAPADPADPTAAWTKHNIDLNLDGARYVHVHDMDSDGDPDVVAIAWYDGVVWYDPPSWNVHNIDASLFGLYEVYVSDIDSDGDPDIVAAGTGRWADEVVWYEAPADPTGSWTKHNIDLNLDGAHGVYVHDIDSDGDPDVVATGDYGPGFVWYEAPPDPTDPWIKHNIGLDLGVTYGGYVYDIDSDGNPDVVATRSGDDGVVWYEAPADPTTAWTKHCIDTDLRSAYGVYVYDIDSDGNPDVVASEDTDSLKWDRVVWYEAPADPTTPWTRHYIDRELEGTAGVYVHDMDADGDADVVTTGFQADAVVWYEAPADPTGTWTKHNIDPNLNGAWGVHVHDVDSDGDADVVATGYIGNGVVWYEAPPDPTDPWIKHYIDGRLNTAFGVCVHDMDADGDPDVVATAEDRLVWYELPHSGGKDYKVIFWEGTATERQTEIITAQDGTLKSQYTFTGTDGPGTWYAGVYDVNYDPAEYSDNLIRGDTFEVHPNIRDPIDPIDFGDVPAGASRLALSHIFNDGPGALTINSITRISGSDEFTYAGRETPFDIAAGSSATVTIRFAPTSAGAKSATFNVNSSDPDEANVTFDVSGNGTAPDIRTPIDPIDFGAVEVGDGLNKTTWIYNDGTAILVVYSITRISGGDEFIYLGSEPFKIAAGAAAPVTIRFAPTSSGAKSATFNVNSSDPDEPDVTFDVSGNGNSPPVANDDAYSTDEDTPLNVPAPGVLANDSDPEGDTLSAMKFIGPFHGTLTLNSDGSFTYMPEADFCGEDTFTYKANDGHLDSNIATVTITVNPVIHPPVANDDAYNADEDTTLNVLAPGVLANDSDPEGDTLSAIKVTDPSHGTLTLNSDGSFTYTPEADFCGPDTFTYKASDGELDSNIATVTIAVYAPWDVVMDWLINIKDVQQVGNHWLEEGEKGWIREDVNDDGAINMMDVIEIGNHWGESCLPPCEASLL